MPGIQAPTMTTVHLVGAVCPVVCALMRVVSCERRGSSNFKLHPKRRFAEKNVSFRRLMRDNTRRIPHPSCYACAEYRRRDFNLFATFTIAIITPRVRDEARVRVAAAFAMLGVCLRKNRTKDVQASADACVTYSRSGEIKLGPEQGVWGNAQKFTHYAFTDNLSLGYFPGKEVGSHCFQSKSSVAANETRRSAMVKYQACCASEATGGVDSRVQNRGKR